MVEPLKRENEILKEQACRVHELEKSSALSAQKIEALEAELARIQGVLAEENVKCQLTENQRRTVEANLIDEKMREISCLQLCCLWNLRTQS